MRLIRKLFSKNHEKTAVYRVHFRKPFLLDKVLRKGFRKALLFANKQEINAIVDQLKGKVGGDCHVRIRLSEKDLNRLYSSFRKVDSFITSKRFDLFDTVDEAIDDAGTCNCESCRSQLAPTVKNWKGLGPKDFAIHQLNTQ